MSINGLDVAWEELSNSKIWPRISDLKQLDYSLYECGEELQRIHEYYVGLMTLNQIRGKQDESRFFAIIFDDSDTVLFFQDKRNRQYLQLRIDNRNLQASLYFRFLLSYLNDFFVNYNGNYDRRGVKKYLDSIFSDKIISSFAVKDILVGFNENSRLTVTFSFKIMKLDFNTLMNLNIQDLYLKISETFDKTKLLQKKEGEQTG